MNVFQVEDVEAAVDVRNQDTPHIGLLRPVLVRFAAVEPQYQ
jgi:hypothetical protein